MLNAYFVINCVYMREQILKIAGVPIYLFLWYIILHTIISR